MSVGGANARSYEKCASRQVAFLGLGVMGYPMAGHLARAGHRVTVYNRTTAKALAWCTEFAATSAPRHALTPREAASGADIVFCCVGNDEDLRSVVLGQLDEQGQRQADGAFAGMKPGAILLDHTTASAQVPALLSPVSPPPLSPPLSLLSPAGTSTDQSPAATAAR